MVVAREDNLHTVLFGERDDEVLKLCLVDDPIAVPIIKGMCARGEHVVMEEKDLPGFIGIFEILLEPLVLRISLSESVLTEERGKEDREMNVSVIEGEVEFRSGSFLGVNDWRRVVRRLVESGEERR